MAVSRDQNAGRSHNIEIYNNSFETVEQSFVLGNNTNVSKFYSGRNEGQI